MAAGSPQEVDIVFAGDAMMHTGQIEAARRQGGVYDYSYCFQEVAPYISGADYAVVNLETPVAGAPYSGYPQFNAPVSYVEALADAGFDLFLTANNHTLDRRDRGLKRTVAVLDSLGLDHIGTYTNAAERSRRLPFVADIGGFKVGFVNYTYGTNGFSVSSDAVVDYIKADDIRRDIASARNAGAEIIVAAMHWGEEYTLTPLHPSAGGPDCWRRKGLTSSWADTPMWCSRWNCAPIQPPGARCFWLTPMATLSRT